MRGTTLETSLRPRAFGVLCSLTICAVLGSCVPVAFAQSSSTAFFAYHGIVNDLDEDGIKGNVILVVGSDGHNRLVTAGEFDDLSTFNIYFDDVTQRSTFGSRAVDVMQVAWLDDLGKVNRTKDEPVIISPGANALLLRDEQMMGMEGGTMGPWSFTSSDAPGFDPLFTTFAPYRQNQSWGILYGMRVIETDEEARTNAAGSIVAESFWNVEVENHIVGPQLGLVWGRSHGPLSFEVQGLALLGYNAARVQLHSKTNIGLVPGALNQPLYARPTDFAAAERHHEFSPAGELRAQSSLQLSPAVAVKLAWTALMIQNVMEADDRIDYQFPGAKLRDPDEQQLFVQSIYCGLDIVR